VTGRGPQQQPGSPEAPPARTRGPGLGARLVERFEPRTRVAIPVRLFVGRQTGEGQIVNISSRGLQLETGLSLRTGAVVEVRRGAQAIVGEVRWVRGSFAGVRLRQRILVQAYLRGESDFTLVPPQAGARRQARAVGIGGAVDWLCAHFQWVALLCAVVAGVAAISGLLDRALAPLGQLHLA